MKFETLMLRGLFIACVTVCGLMLAAMITATPSDVQLAAAGKSPTVAAMPLAAPGVCALPADGVICLPRS